MKGRMHMTHLETATSQEQHLSCQLAGFGETLHLLLVFELDVVRPFWDRCFADIVRSHNVLRKGCRGRRITGGFSCQ